MNDIAVVDIHRILCLDLPVHYFHAEADMNIRDRGMYGVFKLLQ
jgi:hypothetical protein